MKLDISIIESKLNDFFKKYYLNNLIKGLIVIFLVFIVLSLSLIVIEIFSYLSVKEKLFIFVFYLLTFVSISIVYILFPLLGYYNVFRRIKKRKANEIIVSKFPEIKDQLWNLLELRDSSNLNEYSYELINASIEQKINKLKPFKFSDSITFKSNKKLGLFLIIFIFISFVFSISAPEYVKDSSRRLINFNVEYIKPSPYKFELLNSDLNVANGEDFEIKVKVSSRLAFNTLQIEFGNNLLLMNNDSVGYYSYKLNKINNSLEFRFLIDKFSSKTYELNVLQKPVLSNFNIKVLSPSHTNVTTIEYENITELTIAEGSSCVFNFKTFKTDSIVIKSLTDSLIFKSSKEYTKMFSIDDQLFVSLKNQDFFVKDYLSVNVKIIKDLYPLISVQQVLDSANYTRIYFKGNINDDYGFKSLKFVVKVGENIVNEVDIDVLKNLSIQDFFYAYDFTEFKSVNDKIQYYFEVSDNDAVNNFKVTKSEIFFFNFPRFDELVNYQDEKFEDIENYLNKSKEISSDLQKELDEMKRKMIDSDLTEWDKKNILKNIDSKKSALEGLINQLKEENQQLHEYLNSFTETSPELLQKQEQIQKMLEELFSDELKSLLDQFNKMLSDMTEDKVNDLKEKSDISLDDLNKQLDKNMELLKKMKIEQQMDLISQQLDKIDKQQKSDIEKSNNNEDLNAIKESQTKQKEDVKSLKEKYEAIQKLNEELKSKLDLPSLSNEFNKIDEEFSNSIKNSEEQSKKKTKQSLEKNQSNLSNLAFQLKQIKDKAFKEQNFENLEDLVQILNNLLIFSFDQEKILMNNTTTNFNSEALLKQKQLVNNFDVIKDSLYALSGREPSLTSIINKEIVAIKDNFRTIDKTLQDNYLISAKVNQQNIMTSTNNLSLFISEVIKQLQQQMSSNMPGDQNCQKPGNNPNPNSMGNSLKQMQKSLQSQLEKMMQMMKDGQSGKAYNNEVGKALAQQEKMQQMLQQMMKQGNVGSGAFETLKEAELLLNKVREDIMRNNISNQTINREKQILTRLLEAENAENERDLEEKRESSVAKKQQISQSAKYFDNSKANDNFEERMIKQKLIFKSYYQKKYQLYLQSLDSLGGKKN